MLRHVPLSLLVALVALLAACDSSPAEPTASASATALPSSPEDVRLFHRANLAAISDYAAANGLAPDSELALLGGSQAFYDAEFGAGSALSNSFYAELTSAGSGNSGRPQPPSHNLQLVHQTLADASGEADDVADILSAIQSIRESVDAEDLVGAEAWTRADQDDALAYLAIQEETLLWADAEGLLPVGKQRIDAQCFLGVVGSSITGSLIGAGLGLAGGVIGAIGGGLSGYAMFC